MNELYGFAGTSLDQHYAMARLKTCLVIQSQDPTADYLLNCKVVGEELGVLLGIDSIFSALALQRHVGFSGNVAQRNQQEDKFDVIVYDGISTEETIQMIGATSKARLYLKYFQNLAEKADLGRLASPSLLRFANEAISSSTRGSQLNGKMSAEIWDDLEQTLEVQLLILLL